MAKKPDLEFYLKNGREVANRLRGKGKSSGQIIYEAIDAANLARMSIQKRAVLSKGLAKVLLKQ